MRNGLSGRKYQINVILDDDFIWWYRIWNVQSILLQDSLCFCGTRQLSVSKMHTSRDVNLDFNNIHTLNVGSCYVFVDITAGFSHPWRWRRTTHPRRTTSCSLSPCFTCPSTRPTGLSMSSLSQYLTTSIRIKICENLFLFLVLNFQSLQIHLL